MRKIITLLIALVMAFTMTWLLCGCGGDDLTFSGIKGPIKIDCGTEFNLDDYLNENLKIKDAAEDSSKEYKLKDLQYEITCDELYDAEKGTIDTSEYGKFEGSLTINDENAGKASMDFTLKLNPLSIQKGYYVYESDIADSGFDLLGYCSFTNGTKETFRIDEIEFQYFDKDGIMVCSTDMCDYAPVYVGKGQTGFAEDNFSGTEAVIKSPDDIVKVKVLIDYNLAKAENSTTLDCSEPEIIHNFDYNESGFAAEFVVTNNTKKKGECVLLAGMYDADDNLIGMLDCMDRPNITAGGKAKLIACWLPASKARPDKTVKVRAAAYGLSE